MTVVVGMVEGSRVYMGADSQGSNGWDKRYRVDKKVFEAHGILYGFTSSYRMGQILKYHSLKFDIPSPDEVDPYEFVVLTMIPMWKSILAEHGFGKTEQGVTSGGVFLVGFHGRLFRIESDFQVAEHVRPYESVGCGEQYALGALYAADQFDVSVTEKISVAIEAAMEYSNGCGGETEILYIGD